MALLLKNAKCITHEGIYEKDLLIRGEKIQALLERDAPPPNEDLEVKDLTGAFIMPGIIDAHTHYQLHSRSAVTADDFQSGSLSAAAGGVTTFIDYVSQNPETSLPQSLKERIHEASSSSMDFSLHQSIYSLHEGLGEELQAIKEMGVSSVKIFTTYRREGYMFPPLQLSNLFRLLGETELLLTVHAEDNDMIEAIQEDFKGRELTPAMHPHLRPVETEARAIERLVKGVEESGIPLYIAHLSSQAGLERLKEAKERGVPIYGETTPHYLLLDRSFLEGTNPQLYLMTPPLREKEDQEALWRGLVEGYIQLVATDHCAFQVEQKLRSSSPLSTLPGIPGSETLLPLIHHFGVGEGRIDLPTMVKILSTAPARIFGLYPEKGSLLPGTHADLVIFDPKEERTLRSTDLHSKAGYTPYEGMRVRGCPMMTYLRGECIYSHGHFYRKKGYFLKGETSSLYHV